MNFSEKVPTSENDFYYSVLNLHKTASQGEINERHRALSLIFHPDKQHDEKSKTVATKKFLEIQKAYQVLSDPFLREVYDVLGERGLSLRWNPEIRSKSREDVKELLTQLKGDIIYKDLEEQILPKGALACGVDASSLFVPYLGPKTDTLSRQIVNRLEDVRILTFDLKHSTQKKLKDRTTVGVESRVARRGGTVECTLMGTLRHQFSPRITSEANIGLLRPHVIRIGGTYNENGNKVTVRASCMLAALGVLPPSLNISLSRRLFRQRLETAFFELNLGGEPQFNINLISPSLFGFKPGESSEASLEHSAPSTSGLKFGTVHKSFGLSFTSIIPKLVAEWGLTFSELALQLKLGLEFALDGLSCVCSGTWSGQNTTISAATHLAPVGVILRLDFVHLQQQISLPIILSVNHNPHLAFWTVFLPSTALVAGYHFILKPRRHKQRLHHIRVARQTLEEDSGVRREREAIADLLKDTARKLKQAETSKGGLIITEATYGSDEKEDRIMGLAIDVTIPLQALVRNSQLYISANHPKSGIQGFGDPAPHAQKALYIRYLFHGRAHYVEIPDDLPVVLPLAEHLIE